MIPLEVAGISMAPLFVPGDVVGVEPSISREEICLGDIVVLRNQKTKIAIVHRVICLQPLRVKGDRNPDVDQLGEDWQYEGKATQRYREGKWKPIRFGKVLYFLSRFGLFPGQKIPSWLSRSSILGTKMSDV